MLNRLVPYCIDHCIPDNKDKKLHNMTGRRIYFVEFLRIWLILSVLLVHLYRVDYDFKYFHTKLFCLHNAVEFFFIIGGFFLYKNTFHKPKTTVIHRMGKLWLRLAPCVIFGYLILLVLGIQDWGKSPYALSLTMRVGFGAPSVAGGPDWFVGVYFTVSCFLFALFKTARKTAWLWLIVIMFFLWCIQVHVVPVDVPNAPKEMYFSFLSRHVVRGLTCMSLGMIAAAFSDNLHIIQGGGIALRLLATIIEVLALFMVICFMYYHQSFVRFNLVVAEIVFAMLLISTAHGAGYISAFFNRYHWIQYISRYVYSFFIMHGTVIVIFSRYKNFDFDAPTSVCIYLVAVILFTLIEYHIVEKAVVPSIYQWVKKNISSSVAKS